jgi:serine phosphatase RsbU (regulator of sigma subunit)
VTPWHVGDVLRSAQSSDPASIPDIVRGIAGGFGATDVVVYLVDFAQTTLEPLPDRSTHAELPSSEIVATTMAGRAFVDQVPGSAERAEGVRVWVPIVEGSDRTGVLAVTLPSESEEMVRSCEELGLFVGYLIATQARATDLYNLHRRRHSMSLGASMQWDLLPPLVLKTERVAVAGLLEPAYEVAGDCFDYALNGPVLHLGVFDPLGHGVASALIAALCVGSYRHDRRESQTLEQVHAHLDAVVAAQFPEAFATGQVARIDVDTGAMSWTNAGHPLPMLIRGGQVIGEMRCGATMPWGLGSLVDATSVTVATDALEPGDSVLFYTDGVIEGRLPGGDEFGAARLADLAGQHASDQLEPEEVVRRLVRSILEYQDNRLRDDATLVLVRWHGPRR